MDDLVGTTRSRRQSRLRRERAPEGPDAQLGSFDGLVHGGERCLELALLLGARSNC